MKNIIFFLLISVSTFAQNLTLNQGDIVTINSNYSNITFNGRAKLIVNGAVNVQNLNINSKGHITVTSLGYLNVSSSINLNGDTLINNGKVSCSALEVQNSFGYLENNGVLEITNSDIQINHPTGVIKNCGTITVKQSFNINSGRYIACNCSSLTSYGINPNGSIEGTGSLTFKQINLNRTFTNSPNIYVYYIGTVNNQSLWGSAILNSATGCNSSLPVKLSLFKVNKGKDMIIVNVRFEDFDKMSKVRVKHSKDGKSFETVSEYDRGEFILNEIKTLTIKK